MYRLATALVLVIFLFGVEPGFAAVLDGPVLALAQTETPPKTGEEEDSQTEEEEEPDCD